MVTGKLKGNLIEKYSYGNRQVMSNLIEKYSYGNRQVMGNLNL